MYPADEPSGARTVSDADLDLVETSRLVDAIGRRQKTMLVSWITRNYGIRVMWVGGTVESLGLAQFCVAELTDALKENGSAKNDPEA